MKIWKVKREDIEEVLVSVVNPQFDPIASNR